VPQPVGGIPVGGTLSNSLRCVRFTRALFNKTIQQASGADPRVAAPPQVASLYAHLKALGARTVVVEGHYVDRHFIEEAISYYARALIGRRHACVRIHVFATTLTEAGLEHLLQRAASGALQDVSTALNDAYLGYIVVRPLPSVPIGRTVLRPIAAGRAACPTTCRYLVHLAGIELHVEGLAFQQQDRAVGACATTAIWTALQRVCRVDGYRAPTPSAISEAAVRYYLPHGRAYPAPGLTSEQISEALRTFDFAPSVFDVANRPGLFLSQVQTYLRSGIPVILAVVVGGCGHAVTAVGYRHTTRPVPHTFGSHEFDYRNAAIDTLYVHDDRIGPYTAARIEIIKAENRRGDDDVGEPRRSNRVRLVIQAPESKAEVASVRLAMVPLYPKLRTNAMELLDNAVKLLPWIRSIAGMDARLGLETYFDRSGTYQASLCHARLPPARVSRFNRTVVLSRYIGINRWSANGRPLLDALWDTTDTMRAGYLREHLLGLVCYDDAITDAVAKAAKVLGVPFC
jgi:hypothetical protein